MNYVLPNGDIVDLGKYDKDDLIEIEDVIDMPLSQKELAELLFIQSGIVVAG